MLKTRDRSSVVVAVAAALASAAAVPSPLLAGPRIAPVAAICPMDQRERVIDADGEHDHCVGRAAPKCANGTELRHDVTGPADLCVASGAGGADGGKSKPPKCGSGFRLQVVTGKDVCEKAGPPVCPSGSTLKVAQGEDQCRY